MENKYQFIVVTYNHEHCVIDHLESIKYQIAKFKPSNLVQIDIMDDHSTDSTLDLVTEWKKENESFFSVLKIHQNKQNIGIKLTFIEATKLVSSSKFKILAGDDLYSYHNIFDFMDFCEDKPVVFSPIIYLYDNNLTLTDWSFVKVVMAIAKHNDGKKIDIDKIGFNAPGAFVSKSILQLENCQEKIKTFPYEFEDYPLWLFIIEKKYNIYTYKKPLVYYRKGFGSQKNLQRLKLRIFMTQMIKASIFLLLRFLTYSKIILPEKFDSPKVKRHLLEIHGEENKW